MQEDCSRSTPSIVAQLLGRSSAEENRLGEQRIETALDQRMDRERSPVRLRAADTQPAVRGFLDGLLAATAYVNQARWPSNPPSSDRPGSSAAMNFASDRPKRSGHRRRNSHLRVYESKFTQLPTHRAIACWIAERCLVGIRADSGSMLTIISSLRVTQGIGPASASPARARTDSAMACRM